MYGIKRIVSLDCPIPGYVRLIHIAETGEILMVEYLPTAPRSKLWAWISMIIGHVGNIG